MAICLFTIAEFFVTISVHADIDHPDALQVDIGNSLLVSGRWVIYVGSIIAKRATVLLHNLIKSTRGIRQTIDAFDLVRDERPEVVFFAASPRRNDEVTVEAVSQKCSTSKMGGDRTCVLDLE
ncbi:hypothetical protein HDU87_004282 [Geranomyces variabilis]|uniref:Uncharacterized protein n=1 Tax=Geranomyces variabilis TaxID=109894 RepID=A0AAD5TJE9_9FUNG|nr:hypothetical protein HDU87_004282 [Geranomyces variabilis]